MKDFIFLYGAAITIALVLTSWRVGETAAALNRIAAALERQIPACELTDFVPPETAEPLPVKARR